MLGKRLSSEFRFRAEDNQRLQMPFYTILQDLFKSFKILELQESNEEIENYLRKSKDIIYSKLQKQRDLIEKFMGIQERMGSFKQQFKHEYFSKLRSIANIFQGIKTFTFLEYSQGQDSKVQKLRNIDSILNIINDATLGAEQTGQSLIDTQRILMDFLKFCLPPFLLESNEDIYQMILNSRKNSQKRTQIMVALRNLRKIHLTAQTKSVREFLDFDMGKIRYFVQNQRYFVSKLVDQKTPILEKLEQSATSRSIPFDPYRHQLGEQSKLSKKQKIQGEFNDEAGSLYYSRGEYQQPPRQTYRPSQFPVFPVSHPEYPITNLLVPKKIFCVEYKQRPMDQENRLINTLLPHFGQRSAYTSDLRYYQPRYGAYGYPTTDVVPQVTFMTVK